MATKQDLDWSFGLKCHTGKYLTVETFQNKIVAASSAMKKKQIFFLETGEGDGVHIRAHTDRYLSVDGDGKVLCSSESKGEETELLIEAQPDGRWALKSKKYDWYIGGEAENLTAFVKEISEEKLWTVHLAMHPMVTMRNVKRTTYIHLNGESLTTDEVIPWGDDAVLEIQFFEDGTYGLRACNGMFLGSNGAMSTDGDDPKNHFVIEFQGGEISFKSKDNGKYLTALGSSGLCKATKTKIGDDERFVMENSYPQFTLLSRNGMLLSTKQGTELAATKKPADGVSDLEIFQFEPQGGSEYKIRTVKDYVVACDAYTGVKNAESSGYTDADEIFNIEWVGGQMRIKAANGNFIQQRMNKYVDAKAKVEGDDSDLFTFTLVNRPRIAFRGEYGFVNTMPSGLLECNKSEAEIFNLECHEGLYAFKSNGATPKYWKAGGQGFSAVSDEPEYYSLEFQQNSKVAIKTDAGTYLSSSQNGAFTAKGSSIGAAELFEF